jgi:hypothetical protein
MITGLNNKRSYSLSLISNNAIHKSCIKCFGFDQRSLPGVYYAAKPINSQSSTALQLYLVHMQTASAVKAAFA